MCHDMGAKLITFKNYGKYIDFKNTNELKVLNQGEYFWIGAECSTLRIFYWYDENSALPTWFWHNNEPNNYKLKFHSY